MPKTTYQFCTFVLLLPLFGGVLIGCVIDPRDAVNTSLPGMTSTAIQTPSQELAKSTPSLTLTQTQLVDTPRPTGSPVPLAPIKSSSPPLPLLIAFISNGNIWLWRGEKRMSSVLVQTGDVQGLELSDDGKVLAFERKVGDHQYDIWMVNTDGTDERLLISTESLLTIRPDLVDPIPISVRASYAWIPNTHKLAFSTFPIYRGIWASFDLDGLWVVNADNLEQKSLLQIGEGGEFVFSPDGQKIAITTPFSLSLVDPNGSNRQEILGFPGISAGEFYYMPVVNWSLDSRFLFINYTTDSGSTLWLFSVKDSPYTELGNFSNIVGISPNFSRIAYIYQNPEEPTQWQLHIANLDGSNGTVYAAATVMEFLSWIPESNAFIFNMDGNTFSGNVGERPMPLPINLNSMIWVDTAWFLFTRDGELHLGKLDGENILISREEPFGYDFAPKGALNP